MDTISKEMIIQRVHGMTLLPAIILLTLATWQLISYNHYSGQMPAINQIVMLILLFIMSFSALFFRDAQGELARYLESLVNNMRPALIGMSCVLIGGMHFLSILGHEPFYLQMIYVVLIIAYFETASISINFRSHYANGIIDITSGTIQRLLVGMIGRLAMVLVLSVTMIYLSLMVIVGFTGPFSVAFLAAVMILAIAFMTLVRRL